MVVLVESPVVDLFPQGEEAHCNNIEYLLVFNISYQIRSMYALLLLFAGIECPFLFFFREKGLSFCFKVAINYYKTSIWQFG